MNKQLKEKLTSVVETIFIRGINHYKLNGLEYKDTESFKAAQDIEGKKIEALITSEKIQMLERILANSSDGRGLRGDVIWRRTIESELQKLKEENNANNKTPNN